MKKGLVVGLIVGLVVGFVAGSAMGRAEGGGAWGRASDAELYSGEAKDGELVEIEGYGQFRLNAKQRELLEAEKVREAYSIAFMGLYGDYKKISMENPWVLDGEKSAKVRDSYHKMFVALLESRKKAQAGK